MTTGELCLEQNPGFMEVELMWRLCGAVSGGFAIVQPGSKLSINAVEGFPLEDFSAEVSKYTNLDYIELRNDFSVGRAVSNHRSSEDSWW